MLRCGHAGSSPRTGQMAILGDIERSYTTRLGGLGTGWRRGFLPLESPI